jgi:acylphosphatase
MKEQLHAIVRGRVQGVSFRHYTHQRAKELGLTGWVRNLPDGTVEVTAEGERETLEQLLGFLDTGPLGAHVVHVLKHWQPASDQYHDFDVSY